MTSPRPQTLPIVPVFPLTDFHFFPGTLVPLHIFETRYRQMVQDMMDGPGRFVTVPLEPQGPRDETGPVLPRLGTLAEIVQTEELDDGRWLILLLALARVEIGEVPSDRLYRRVEVEVVPEADVAGEAVDMLRGRLLAALRERADGQFHAIPEDPPLGRVADVLLHALPLEPERRRRAYGEQDPVARAALALAWHDLAEVAEGRSSGPEPAPGDGDPGA